MIYVVLIHKVRFANEAMPVHKLFKTMHDCRMLIYRTAARSFLSKIYD
jgi:hypothetical protein